ncbi:MAG: hypothetical protein IKJ77_04660 [Firmicutes bacterium]|nr:hypothetical protein [Bacillota bacterium]
MKKRIFGGIFTAGLVVLVASLLFIVGLISLEYNKEFAREIKNESQMIAHAVEISGAEYFEDLKLTDVHRLTWVDTDGTVLYDSVADQSSMVNHKDRPEIREAMESGYGEDVRHSDTIGEKTMYSAVRLKDGTVVRVSQVRFTMASVFIELVQEIILILLMAGALAFVLARSISRSIVEPLLEIDLHEPDKERVYKEVQPLVDRIAEQNLALESQITQLKVDVDEKTREADFRKEFTANVSHELKTPLTSISGFAELIKTGFVREEDIPRFGERIYDEAQRLIVLVEDILKLSQLDEKKFDAKREDIDLYLLCEDVIFTLDSIAKKGEIDLQLEGEHVFVEGVQQILSEIVYNLCDNAIKYNRRNGAVCVRIFEEEGRPAVSVTDTGIGIPAEDLDRIFERFFRVNKSHSKEIGGTGLGLSIVKHGAAYHNAEIRVDSRLGEGTCITVVF